VAAFTRLYNDGDFVYKFHDQPFARGA